MKRKKIILQLVTLVLIASLVIGGIFLSTQLEQDQSAEDSSASTQNFCTSNTPNITISSTHQGKEITLTTTERLAGAIDSLTYDGVEFINSYDHGRQIQYALTANEYGECYNPTEAGSRSDGTGESTTSQFLEGCKLADNLLTTKTQMAFWLRPEEDDQAQFCRNTNEVINETPLSDYTVNKKVEIGYKGLNNIVRFDTTFTFPEKVNAFRLEAPAAYHTDEFEDYYYIDLRQRELILLDAEESEITDLNAPFDYARCWKDVIPVLSDGRFYSAGYLPGSFESCIAASYDSASPTVKWSLRDRGTNRDSGEYTYGSFMYIGTREELLTSLQQTLNRLPFGALDYIREDSGFTKGWAIDYDSPSEVVSINFFYTNSRGEEVLFDSTTTSTERSDVTERYVIDRSVGFEHTLDFNQIPTNTSVITIIAKALDDTGRSIQIGEPITLDTTKIALLQDGSDVPVATNCTNLDNNLDGRVTLADLANFATFFGSECTFITVTSPCGSIDSNQDNFIDLIDLANLATQFGDTCE